MFRVNEVSMNVRHQTGLGLMTTLRRGLCHDSGMAAFTWTTRIRFVDTDASQRIHYTALFRFFEAAEQEFLRELGLVYSGLADSEAGWPRVRAECDISGALVYDDEIDIEISVNRVGTSSFELGFRAIKESQECAKGKVVIACMNTGTQRAQALPEAFATALRNHAQ